MSVYHKLYISCCILIAGSMMSACSADSRAVKITEGLDHPWSMVFLASDEILISERAGSLRRIVKGELLSAPVSGLPDIVEKGQGGLLGLALHPQFEQNRWLYFAYAAGNTSEGYSTHLARGRYSDGKLTDVQVLFAATPKTSGGRHFGGRVLFDRAGYVYLALGDRGDRELAQQLENHTGSLIRLHDDGRVPKDNPFVNKAGLMPEIYSYGHRNIQGLALNPFNGYIWSHEHGPQGGDEINLHKKGANYGWPVISYGEEYGGGAVGAGLNAQTGLEQPLHYWTPSIAPSGMTFYTGDRYLGWKGNLFVGSLKVSALVRLTFEGNKVISEERLLEDEIGRIRDVQQAPDGYLYVLTDESDGGLYRVE
uniref:PQQ-dependent oxidoreductase, gdhB family n=1 Tax=uncultured Thiotrichaceae bacterium TaxID=298394 RepID=A0A6S6TWN4_9GAMM|nr:MAG: PQQ-dependent oxidoreductase, gdhB family [uncultured Thiotrichaceae bacterium]